MRTENREGEEAAIAYLLQLLVGKSSQVMEGGEG